MRPWSYAFGAASLLTCGVALSAALDGCVLPSFVLEAKPDAATLPDTGPPPGCVLTTYPDPPGGTDSATKLPPVVFAVHTIDLGDMSDTPGYDQDHLCTCFDAGPSCTGRSAQATTYCDAPGGVDNQAAKLFTLIELSVGSGLFGSAYFSEKANDGNWSLLIQLTGWSGMPDDPEVEVALFPSAGVHLPLWKGGDAWPVTHSSVTAEDGGAMVPSFRSNGAYVTAGTLVATIPTSEITLAGAGLDTITITLSAGVLTGKLVQGPDGWTLAEGVIAARWSLADVFQALSSYRDNSGQPICTDGISYKLAKQVICTDADILVDGTQPKSAPCNALSVGLGFTADPALLGPVADAGVATVGCAPASDPASDSCQ